MHQLSTFEIEDAMKNVPNFLGVFALDKLPRHVPAAGIPVKMIVNLQASNLPGNYRVAVYRRADGRGYYFDTFGCIPPLEIQHWLQSNCSEWTYNKLLLQSPFNTVLCGYLCMQFLSVVD
jgi:hypothetical protein